ncbi:hypothetical protein PQX77_009716 [Marasmius sp. AFHP31]|nr:hypothetical protein PQX77_009716 [Marasmius sp. AFHP31]
MVLNPEVQARAQAEIDEAFGLSGLPDFHDRDRLPFVNAVIAETLRWNPVLHLGATIIPNVWGVMHDETIYGPDVMDFEPERFLKKEGKVLPPNPETFVFGFGRRICPGRYFAMNTVFLVVTHILATFTLAKPLDEGKEYTPKAEWDHGLIW